MGRIRVLDDHLVNRIAAGEVVERPASVVKELLENSLDAGASNILVAVKSGGRRSIRVTDDGCGMARDDAILALERHATSKLGPDTDLHAIATLGFRGEALPSIAAVSRFMLRTATAEGPATEITIHGGTIRDVREVAAPRGTEIEVARLFYNVPARRKFLRTEATELSHIGRLVTRYALAHPRIQFRLESGRRRMIEATSVADTDARIAQLFGRQLTERLLPFTAERTGLLVCGYAGRPVDGTRRRDVQHLFVNGRPVQDRVLLHAVRAAYENTMPRGQVPALFLFVELDPGRVDVNVHPQKTEVRFTRGGEIHDLARDAVRAALNQITAVPSLGDLRPADVAGPSTASLAGTAIRFLEQRADSGAAGEPRPIYGATAPPVAPVGPPATTPIFAQLDERADVFTPLGQLRESYIVAVDGEGLVLIDQHAAHERVLFESYLHDAEQDRVEIQQLLFPVTVELPVDESTLLEEELGEFARLGFRIEPFGRHTIRIDAVPAVAAGIDPARLLRDLLGEAAQVQSTKAGVMEVRRRLVTTAACHAAIKVNHPLSRPEMQRLLSDLAQVENPTTCPHGRPALFRLTLPEIERAFRRR